MALIDELKKLKGSMPTLGRQPEYSRAAAGQPELTGQEGSAWQSLAKNYGPGAGPLAAGARNSPRWRGEQQGQGVIPQAQAAAPQATAPKPVAPSAPAVSDAYPDESRRAASAPLRGISPLSAQATRTSATGAPGVQRIDNVQGLRSPLFTNAEPGQAIAQMQGGAGVSTIGGPSAQQLSEQADRMRALREGNTAMRDEQNFNAGGALSRQKTEAEIARDLLTGNSRSGRQAGLGLVEGARRAQTESERAKVDAARDERDFGLREAEQKSASELRGVQTDTGRLALSSAQQEQALVNRIMEAQPEERAGLIQSLNAMRGKEAKEDPRQRAVIELTKAYADSTVPPVDESGKPMSLEAFVSKGLQLAAAPGANGQNSGIPPGMRQIGTSGGRPVYQDANGNKFIGE